MDLGKLLFPKYHPSRRRKEIQFLKLGLVLGGLLSVIIGLILYALFVQGRL